VGLHSSSPVRQLRPDTKTNCLKSSTRMRSTRACSHFCLGRQGAIVSFRHLLSSACSLSDTVGRVAGRCTSTESTSDFNRGRNVKAMCLQHQTRVYARSAFLVHHLSRQAGTRTPTLVKNRPRSVGVPLSAFRTQCTALTWLANPTGISLTTRDPCSKEAKKAKTKSHDL
jgi:hypothetical protein